MNGINVISPLKLGQHQSKSVNKVYKYVLKGTPFDENIDNFERKKKESFLKTSRGNNNGGRRSRDRLPHRGALEAAAPASQRVQQAGDLSIFSSSLLSILLSIFVFDENPVFSVESFDSCVLEFFVFGCDFQICSSDLWSFFSSFFCFNVVIIVVLVFRVLS